MTNEEIIAAHKELAAFHSALAEHARLDMVRDHHAELAIKLSREAERLHKLAN